MLDSLGAIFRDECGLVKGRAIIVGVSGGPDSLCLMQALRQAGYPIVVAHFNHHLRPEAELEAQAVGQLAAQFALDSILDGADVGLHAGQQRLSLEEAARDLRYRFLFGLARERNAQAVAVGHTADDQVETVLMHFLRGSGLAGLKGMSHRSIIKSFDPDIPIVRPLLDISREATIAYCTAQGLTPHYDPSNDSLDFQRNRIRHLLIPNLETYNPKIREAVLRMTRSLREDHALLKDALEPAWREAVSDLNKNVVTFDLDFLRRQNSALQRNLVKQAMQHLLPDLDLNFAALERARSFINDPNRMRRTELGGGLRMLREGGRIHISRSDADLSSAQWPQMPETPHLPVSIPCEIDLSGAWKFTCMPGPDPAAAREQAEQHRDPFEVWLDADRLPRFLQLRVRLAGDQFEPFGMEGHSQKLSDFMVNEKMPQRARDRWPLLCSEGMILWVPGHRPAHACRLTDSTQKVAYFSITCPQDKDDR